MVYYRLFSFIIRYTIVSDFKLLDQSQVAECTIWIGKTVEKLVPTMPPSSMAFLAAVGPTFKKKQRSICVDDVRSNINDICKIRGSSPEAKWIY